MRLVDHAVEPYSTCFLLAPRVAPASLRRIPSLLLAFVSVLAICGFLVKCDTKAS